MHSGAARTPRGKRLPYTPVTPEHVASSTLHPHASCRGGAGNTQSEKHTQTLYNI